MIPILPENFKELVSHYLNNDGLMSPDMVCHTRSKGRGGVFRILLENNKPVIVKIWRARNLREHLKVKLKLSNAWREWNMHNYLFRKGIIVPKPLGYHHLTIKNNEMCEIMAIEDLGKTERAFLRIKHLAKAANSKDLSFLEDAIIDITEKITKLKIVDIDHQLNNLLLNNCGKLFRIDFECARHRKFHFLYNQAFEETISRLIASHVYAAQPHTQYSINFAQKVYTKLNIPPKKRFHINDMVNYKLQKQKRSIDVVTSIKLPE